MTQTPDSESGMQLLPALLLANDTSAVAISWFLVLSRSSLTWTASKISGLSGHMSLLASATSILTEVPGLCPYCSEEFENSPKLTLTLPTVSCPVIPMYSPMLAS